MKTATQEITKLEELRAALEAACNAYYTAIPYAAGAGAWDAYQDAWGAYYAELKGTQKGNPND